MTQTERRRFLLSRLLAEAPEYRQLAVPDDAAGQKQLLRALLNVRPPRDASPEFLQVQDEYLRAELAQKGVTVLESLTPAARCGEAALYLWQGDITTLQCDAIVNAANSGMTGCYVPGHRCIDNPTPHRITHLFNIFEGKFLIHLDCVFPMIDRKKSPCEQLRFYRNYRGISREELAV